MAHQLGFPRSRRDSRWWAVPTLRELTHVIISFSVASRILIMNERSSGSRGGEGASSIAKAIYQGLYQEITTGVLKPGELLSRRRIAERYGCSYTPVIEALVRLEHSGLIEAESSQMARVRKETVETIQSNY